MRETDRSFRYYLRRLIFVVAGGLVLAAAIVGVGGCRSYPGHVARWNFLAPTPYMRAEHKPAPKSWSSEQVTVSWLGQATVLINLRGTTILTDPVLLKRIAPPYLGGKRNMGIRRTSELPLRPADLPPIDLVLLSHTHYDHWDLASLKHFGKSTRAVIPVGARDLIPAGSVGEAAELAWGQEIEVGQVTVRAFEVEHYGGRSFSDKHPRACNGYVISGPDTRLAFIGDSAFWRRSAWPQRGTIDWAQRTGPGPFDLCILPIGAYYFSYNHMSPEEAWRLCQEVGGKRLLGTHWRTFILVPPEAEPLSEPMERLKAAAGGEADRLICDEPGKVFVLPPP